MADTRNATRDEEQYPAPIDLLTAEIEKLKRETDGGWSPDARSSLARIEFFTRRVLVEQIQSAESERAEPIDSARWRRYEAAMKSADSATAATEDRLRNLLALALPLLEESHPHSRLLARIAAEIPDEVPASDSGKADR